MKLYSIRHKDSGKFLVNIHPVSGPYWTHARPHFWTTPDGIDANLKRLGGVMRPWDGTYEDLMANPTRSRSYNVIWDNFDPARLERIEVITTSVDIMGEERSDAVDWVANTSE